MYNSQVKSQYEDEFLVFISQKTEGADSLLAPPIPITLSDQESSNVTGKYIISIP